HAGRLDDERRGVGQLVGIHAGERTAGDVARDVAARAHGRHALEPERAEDVGQALERDPVQLDVLADGDVGDPATMPRGEVGDRPELMGLEGAVRDPDTHHEVANGFALASLAADRTDAVALGIEAPPAEVRAEPLGRHRIPALPREALDVGIRLPGIELALEPLHALRLGLFRGLTHGSLQNAQAARPGLSLGPTSRRLSLASTSP